MTTFQGRWKKTDEYNHHCSQRIKCDNIEAASGTKIKKRGHTSSRGPKRCQRAALSGAGRTEHKREWWVSEDVTKMQRQMTSVIHGIRNS